MREEADRINNDLRSQKSTLSRVLTGKGDGEKGKRMQEVGQTRGLEGSTKAVFLTGKLIFITAFKVGVVGGYLGVPFPENGPEWQING